MMMSNEVQSTVNPPSHLVVVGASAGGIEALSGFVSGLPTDLGAPIVIAQHLSRNRNSSLSSILESRTSLRVQTVETSAKLSAATIYVVPANRDVLISDHEVSVVESDSGDGKPSVDLLFRSAAAAYQENLVAVVLSGTGSDGAAGAQEVKNAGGTIIIQNPETATFPGMPRSLPQVLVDAIAEPVQMGALIAELISGASERRLSERDVEIRSFLAELRDEEGIDFTSYKQPTIRRRLQRRMAASGHRTLSKYVTFAREDTDERQHLINSFLINVTEFFRDHELFEYLRQQIIPEIVTQARERESELRIWSAGCSTGEEAYSLAILISEYLRENDIDQSVRIFATDLDSEAITFARKGVYSARSLEKLPPDLRERYFHRRDGMFEVTKELRSLLVFGEHGLGQRAPFPRIDLVVCRNVLIYFTSALQRHALQLFAFSLRSGGYLVVGKSESVGAMSEYFVLDNSRYRVFRRLGNQAALPLGMKDMASLSWVPTPSRLQRNPSAGTPNGMSGGHLAVRGILRGRSEEVIQNLTTGVVVVNDHYDIQLINATARRYFGIHVPAIGEDFLHLVTSSDPLALRRLIDRTLRGESSESIRVEEQGSRSGEKRILEIAARAIGSPKEDDPPLVMIEAVDVSARERAIDAVDSARAVADDAIRSNEEILSANLELTSTIASLRAENEELLVATEEIQAATEEMETLNEELHATNEELETLNEELQATAEELNTANDDLQARTVELQEMARTSEERRSRLGAILFRVHQPIVVVGPDGLPIYRNEAFRSTIDVDNATFKVGATDGAPLDTPRFLRYLAQQETPFEVEAMLGSETDESHRLIVRGQGDWGDDADHSFTVIEIDMVKESST
jgi:two-component system CheB/CheR fusion protein